MCGVERMSKRGRKHMPTSVKRSRGITPPKETPSRARMPSRVNILRKKRRLAVAVNGEDDAIHETELLSSWRFLLDLCMPHAALVEWLAYEPLLTRACHDPLPAVHADPFTHPVVTAGQRAMLLDWMMQIGSEFCLSRETVHSSMCSVDRVLQLSPEWPLRRLQLLGTVCLHIHGKLNETAPPRAIDYVVAGDGAFALAELHTAELEVLRLLDYRLHVPNVYSWSVLLGKWLGTRLAKTRAPPSVWRELFGWSAYNARHVLLETALLDPTSCCFGPRTLAAAALVVLWSDCSIVDRLPLAVAQDPQLSDCCKWLASLQLPATPLGTPVFLPAMRDFHIPEAELFGVQRHHPQLLTQWQTHHQAQYEGLEPPSYEPEPEEPETVPSLDESPVTSTMRQLARFSVARVASAAYALAGQLVLSQTSGGGEHTTPVHGFVPMIPN